jgi:ribosomal protein S2
MKEKVRRYFELKYLIGERYEIMTKSEFILLSKEMQKLEIEIEEWSRS